MTPLPVGHAFIGLLASRVFMPGNVYIIDMFYILWTFNSIIRIKIYNFEIKKKKEIFIFRKSIKYK